VDTRTRVLEAASTLLQASTDRDISTRAVSEAVGIGTPMLYRLFGDKNGLLAAVVDHAFDGYLTQKRDQPPSDDPADDLYLAWDAHVEFAMDNPTVYRIAFGPSLDYVPAGVEKARELLLQRFVRCAEAGQLNTTPDNAAQAMMAAAAGVCLCMLSQPAGYDDPELSRRVRDAVLAGLLVKKPVRTTKGTAGRLETVALQLAALIRSSSTSLTGAESGMLLQWLDTIGTTANPVDPRVPTPGADAAKAPRPRRLRRRDGD
jgi:AcrR family transcriptional regulator